MLGFGEAVHTLSTILSTYKNSETMKESVTETLKNMNNKSILVKADGNITKILSKYVVEPIIISSTSVRDIPVFDKVIQVNTDIFASFYLQLFNILLNEYGLTAKTIIDIMSTTYSDLEKFNAIPLNMIGNKIVSKEDYLSSVLSTEEAFIKISIEDVSVNFDNKDKKIDENDALYTTLIRNLQITYDLTDKENNKKSISLPIIIKAHVINTSIDNIINMLQPNARDKKFSARWDEYRAGAITLKELIFCSDLIDKYKKNKLKDKSDLLSVINSRNMNANVTAINTKGIKGFEANYNMLIVSSDDKILLDKHIGGDILKEKHKQDLLTEAHAMTCTILDQDYERANILIKDIRGNTDIGFKALAKRKEKDSSDLSNLLQSLLMNKPIGL